MSLTISKNAALAVDGNGGGRPLGKSKNENQAFDIVVGVFVIFCRTKISQIWEIVAWDIPISGSLVYDFYGGYSFNPKIISLVEES